MYRVGAEKHVTDELGNLLEVSWSSELPLSNVSKGRLVFSLWDVSSMVQLCVEYSRNSFNWGLSVSSQSVGYNKKEGINSKKRASRWLNICSVWAIFSLSLTVPSQQTCGLSLLLYNPSGQSSEALGQFSQHHRACKSKTVAQPKPACTHNLCAAVQNKKCCFLTSLAFYSALILMDSAVIKVKLIMYERQSVNSLLRKSKSGSRPVLEHHS